MIVESDVSDRVETVPHALPVQAVAEEEARAVEMALYALLDGSLTVTLALAAARRCPRVVLEGTTGALPLTVWPTLELVEQRMVLLLQLLLEVRLAMPRLLLLMHPLLVLLHRRRLRRRS